MTNLPALACLPSLLAVYREVRDTSTTWCREVSLRSEGHIQIRFSEFTNPICRSADDSPTLLSPDRLDGMVQLLLDETFTQPSPAVPCSPELPTLQDG